MQEPGIYRLVERVISLAMCKLSVWDTCVSVRQKIHATKLCGLFRRITSHAQIMHDSVNPPSNNTGTLANDRHRRLLTASSWLLAFALVVLCTWSTVWLLGLVKLSYDRLLCKITTRNTVEITAAVLTKVLVPWALRCSQLGRLDRQNI